MCRGCRASRVVSRLRRVVRDRGSNYGSASSPTACEVSLWMRNCLGTTGPRQRKEKDDDVSREDGVVDGRVQTGWIGWEEGT